MGPGNLCFFYAHKLYRARYTMRWACLLFIFLISFCSGEQDPGRVIYHDAVTRNSEREAPSSKILPPPPRGFPLRLEDHAGQPEIFSLVSPLASRIDL